ncbi:MULTISPECIES: protocatechuate 3,4-dioxygenase [unclassified Sphingobium]|uniref:DODA-type extradiol aromatic ring-opening family dioxygenase n=1 Tax=unclassified Sphingobium TaxID=2611147 RepID=UPI000D16FFCC|nr:MULTISPECIES: protocatechuate 3,4-dioxygenase [unclassified Sphingobium]MBG6120222.1 3-O-methylgallate 3,4-dioxygenase [Sphingobium sp. JAI105]PSO09965.1 protocatechuate 3,4-dioxygenase [Sphingobium sp. AEW4]TWD00122.1 3-O-methylgallate 3,4-dioxygenase [Sphingobium sp. AEW010]TWD19243.1 3-O-methylgallate 3,4-dioxygenase [Sphingobium sp. AEW013]TWD22092.1 3-O-methylgallate 3,4-dioxygenase [Sphingobium sp. AEW001]
MAEIVLGIGTSHGPMLVTETELWGARLPADRAAMHAWRGGRWSFDDLVAARSGEGLAEQITEAAWDERQQRCQAAIEQLADVFAAAKPDVAVIIGNDQMEIFDERLIPAFSVFYGDAITNFEFSAERMAKLPVGIAESIPGYIPPGGETSAGHPELALKIIEGAMEDEFDVAAMKMLPKPETPHAFGFVFRRIMRDRPIPTVPVLINTFYPPNQPTVGRCHAFGKSILRAIQAWPSDLRVAIIASGGLTHFVIDEALDAMFLDSLRSGDMARVTELGEGVFQDGTSEIKNWVPVAGAMAELGLTPHVVDYVPCYRSEAGTGNAMGFVYWQA